mmetsp:Transcript_6766/g.17299  ORF Transcript_6766/g.17299 Transcript_6766/m.17299 type:complete len:259 (-) Transcript_6766:333-1109(-)
MASETGPVRCCPSTRCALAPATEYAARGAFASTANPRSGKDLRFYKVHGPAGSRKAILLMHDIFGVNVGRHVGVCDALAEACGCTVVCADLFHGDAATMEIMDTPAELELLQRHPPQDIAQDLDFVYEHALPADQFDSIGMVGFCWGCWVLYLEACREADPRLRGGANFHPALMVARSFDSHEKELVATNKLPMLVCPCSDDFDNVKPGGILPESAKIHLFENQLHGFMTQGDVDKEEVRQDIDKGIELAAGFFASIL